MLDRTNYASKLLLTSFLLSGCVLAAKDRAPVMYPFSEMRDVAVLPILDSHPDKKEKVRFDGTRVPKLCMKTLSKRRYRPVASVQGFAALKGLTEEDLKKATPELMKSLGPENVRWVLVVCLADVSSRLTAFPGSSANAQVFGFLFDKTKGKLAWSDLGTGHMATRGLVGMVTKSSNRSTAIALAIRKMLEAFPKLPKAAE